MIILQLMWQRPTLTEWKLFTPAHGSWLNIAKIEFSVFTMQELDRPFSSKEGIIKVVEKWKNKQNEETKEDKLAIHKS
ncbi:hypothetical protein QNI19_09100 [Cytophagaceae bacterium DM2B3-1]|uniref:Tc1-like transposase DDE domain-containing protein n=1 Tax=Xanthocytophaga flava TaxID=3048013 RepID=A0ABT7CHC1_9BACT|nr:hypothetical protein [Xanthocytophaga flavus]MDJ1493088.1 hypothetical protein [Xanthocytophaga flavus]